MKKAFVILACLFVSLLSLYCTKSQPKSKIKQQTTPKRVASPLDGFRILSDVADSTVKYKEIARYLYPKDKNWITITYVVLQIENDSMSCVGINGFASRKVKINLQDKTKLYETDETDNDTTRCKYTFSFNANTQMIEAKTKGKVLIYKKFTDTSNKIPLITRDERTGKMGFAAKVFGGYFEELFLKGFIIGKYQSIDKQQDIQAFDILLDYDKKKYFTGVGAKVEGFRNFTNIQVDDHFASYFPFEGKDGFSFQKLSGDGRSIESYEAYEFRYKGDTLFLQEVIKQKEGDMSYNVFGTRKYKFLKIK